MVHIENILNQTSARILFLVNNLKEIELIDIYKRDKQFVSDYKMKIKKFIYDNPTFLSLLYEKNYAKEIEKRILYDEEDCCISLPESSSLCIIFLEVEVINRLTTNNYVFLNFPENNIQIKRQQRLINTLCIMFPNLRFVIQTSSPFLLMNINKEYSWDIYDLNNKDFFNLYGKDLTDINLLLSFFNF